MFADYYPMYSRKPEEHDVIVDAPGIENIYIPDFMALAGYKNDPKCPSSFLDIKNFTAEEQDLWNAAVQEELMAMTENRVWSIVEKPTNKQLSSCKWVFTIKSNGKRKARLVACGPQSDLEEVYAPVAKMPTVKTFFVIVNENNMNLEQLDVKSAFLHADLSEEIYMRILPGLNLPKGNLHTSSVCKLHKALYGLRVSPRRWNLCLHTYLIELGFIQSSNDLCLYIKVRDDVEIFLLVYVDDILIASKSLSEISCLKELLKNRFRMTDLGNVKKFLGIEIERNRKEGIIEFHQKTYIEELITVYKQEHTKTPQTPIEANPNLQNGNESVDASIPFRNLIGALLYIASLSRPDVAFAANYLSRYQASYTKTHFKHALRVLSYLTLSLPWCFDHLPPPRPSKFFS